MQLDRKVKLFRVHLCKKAFQLLLILFTGPDALRIGQDPNSIDGALDGINNLLMDGGAQKRDFRSRIGSLKGGHGRNGEEQIPESAAAQHRDP
jgi:hypothetical protein